jgi:hypothetical protein
MQIYRRLVKKLVKKLQYTTPEFPTYLSLHDGNTHPDFPK